MTFCSSRTFPGHGYDRSRSSVRLLMRRKVLPHSERKVDEVLHKNRNVFPSSRTEAPPGETRSAGKTGLRGNSAVHDRVQVTIGGGDDSNVDTDGLRPPTRSNTRSCSTRSSATCVSGGAHHFVQKDGSAIRQLEPAIRLCVAPVKAPFRGRQLEASSSREWPRS